MAKKEREKKERVKKERVKKEPVQKEKKEKAPKEGGASFLKMSIGSGGKRVSKYPEKTTINLVRYETEKSNLGDILAIAVIVLGIVAFAKFAVLDQMDALRQAQMKYGVVQDQLTTLRQANAKYAEVKAKYDEVTDWYMTTDEKQIIDKVAVMQMLEEDLMPYVELMRVQVSGNVVTVATGETNLSTVSKFLMILQQDPRNSSATVTTTSAASSAEGEQRVTAAVIINFVGEKPAEVTPAVDKEELRRRLLGDDA